MANRLTPKTVAFDPCRAPDGALRGASPQNRIAPAKPALGASYNLRRRRTNGVGSQAGAAGVEGKGAVSDGADAGGVSPPKRVRVPGQDGRHSRRAPLHL